jgi:hypothetical protein
MLLCDKKSRRMYHEEQSEKVETIFRPLYFSEGFGRCIFATNSEGNIRI